MKCVCGLEFPEEDTYILYKRARVPCPEPWDDISDCCGGG